jgi:hypothetical protein
MPPLEVPAMFGILARGKSTGSRGRLRSVRGGAGRSLRLSVFVPQLSWRLKRSSLASSSKQQATGGERVARPARSTGVLIKLIMLGELKIEIAPTNHGCPCTLARFVAPMTRADHC